MSFENSVRDVVVVGSGLAGLTAAYELRQRGIEALVLEKERDVGASWARRHPQLTLNTHRSLSSLPGLDYPAGTGAFPKRDTVVAHLKSFQDRHRFSIDYGVEAVSAVKSNGQFLLQTNLGVIRTRNLIIATGRDADPLLPRWKGMETFGGRIIHAADFGEAKAYAGHSVLVVGGGNSGFDILNHLSRVETGPVWLSVRRGPGLLPKRLGGFAVHRFSPLMARLPTPVADRLIGWTQKIAFGDLAKLGFPPGPVDAATRLAGSQIAIAVDDGAIGAIRRRRISVVPDVAEFSSSGVILSDGASLRPDIVIAAVGYSTTLTRWLGPLGAIDEDGHPLLSGTLGATVVPGLWLVGMKPSLTSYFRQAQREAKDLARTIASTLQA